jgi:predicted  nucleic acid-binding Zn-ribbon protein
LTDTVGQHSIEEPISGWTNIANFEMRELTAAEKAAAEKAAVDNAASEVRITAAKTKYSELSSEIDRLIKQYPSKRSEIELDKKKIALFERIDQINVANVELNLAGIESKLVAMRSIYSKIARTITCTKGKVTKKVTDVTPKCPAGYKKK